jgi:mannose-1-phosphate guanylyltransferase
MVKGGGFMLYVVILAGGRGERFWPKSTRRRPKQFQNILAGRTMIQETLARVHPDIPAERIYVVAGPDLKDIILEQLPQLNEANLIVEPEGRNTAPAIGLAAVWLDRIDPGGTMAVLTSDHVVGPRERFLRALDDAAEAAGECTVVTFGVEPDRPATEFGYIELGPRIETHGFDVFSVKRFREKPTRRQAGDFLERGNFLWNSGMFVFRIGAFLEAVSARMPVMYRGLMKVRDALGTPDETRVLVEEYARFERTSIDYGIMEKESDIACVKASFSWDDVGSWGSLTRHLPADERGNVVQGNAALIDSGRNVVVCDDGSVVSLVGISDAIVVKQGERVLVCRRSMDQNIKELLKHMSGVTSLEHFL